MHLYSTRGENVTFLLSSFVLSSFFFFPSFVVNKLSPKTKLPCADKSSLYFGSHCLLGNYHFLMHPFLSALWILLLHFSLSSINQHCDCSSSEKTLIEMNNCRTIYNPTISITCSSIILGLALLQVAATVVFKRTTFDEPT